LAQYQITKVRLPDVNSRVDHITHVLVPSYDPQYPIKVGTVIAMIQQGHSFYVSQGHYRAEVKVAPRGLLGSSYIRTQSDQTKVDNLLSLPQC
jgi:hypothetical protein